MNFHILTLFPDMIMQGLSTSIIGRAKENGLLSIEAVNIRDYSQNKHKKVDDYPYGGGAGMLMQAQPVYDAWKSVVDKIGYKPRTVYLTPQGHTFTQPMAKEFAKEEDLVLLCGHYEGIDERVLEEIVTDYMSIGDYVLTGGELPAMVMIDAISRMVPGVLNNEESGETESFEGNLLEYPQYSRPEVWIGKEVPKVLMSGNQKKIRTWRKEAAIIRTKERRPDLYAKYEALDLCCEILRKQKLLHVDMTELIARGQAELVYQNGATVCLYDTVSGNYFHTTDNHENGLRGLEEIMAHAKLHGNLKTMKYLCLHQEYMQTAAWGMFDMRTAMNCKQAVYTQKEKLPITGLYSMDEKNSNYAISIHKLNANEFEKIIEHYTGIDERTYLQDRMNAGWLYGATYEGELAGFIGVHKEGSIGLLEVFPEFRGKRIGKALETYMINLSLELGHTPYAHVMYDNECSICLQESLGLYFARTNVYWLKRFF